MCRKLDTKPPTYLTIHGFVCRQSLLNHPAYGAATVNGAWAGVKAAVARVPLSHTDTFLSLFCFLSLILSRGKMSQLLLCGYVHMYININGYIYIHQMYTCFKSIDACVSMYIVCIICIYDYTCMHIYRT